MSIESPDVSDTVVLAVVEALAPTVMNAFGGSGSTAHATLTRNKQGVMAIANLRITSAASRLEMMASRKNHRLSSKGQGSNAVRALIHQGGAMFSTRTLEHLLGERRTTNYGGQRRSW